MLFLITFIVFFILKSQQNASVRKASPSAENLHPKAMIVCDQFQTFPSQRLNLPSDNGTAYRVTRCTYLGGSETQLWLTLRIEIGFAQVICKKARVKRRSQVGKVNF